LLLVTERSAMAELERNVEQVARSPVTLLISGETGVGKEVLARQIHTWSDRRGAFVPVNCGALPRDLAASELFGHAKGAFSGAAAARRGVFPAAQGGTLLLDEVGELPLELQPLLLRALQERAIRPVGADFEQPIDVRVIAATNVRLDAAVSEGRFRPDLYARLAQMPIEIPPLRERREQILELARTFAANAEQELKLTADAAEALLLWAWPFNVRELENLIRRWCAMTQPGPALGLEFLRGANPAIAATIHDRTSSPPAASGSGSFESGTLKSPLNDPSALEALLASCDGNVSEVARRMNTTRSQVYRWLKRFGLEARARGDGS
jgi:transcriptional regulator with GAF, ATPase, and Fis domain